MSDHTNPDLMFRNNFNTPYVGGSDDDPEFLARRHLDQKTMLEQIKDDPRHQIVNYDENDNYDLYEGYLSQQGLLGTEPDKNIRYTKHAINIDSRHRNMEPIIDRDETYLLDVNPLQFTEGSRQVFIRHLDHNMVLGDKFTLTGVRGSTVTVRSKFSQRQYDGSLKEGVILLNFTKDSDLVRVNHPHGLNIENRVTTAQVEFVGVKGNILSTYLENVPINLINKKHLIIIPDQTDSTHTPFMASELAVVDDIADPIEQAAALKHLLESFFFIKLPITFDGSFAPKNYNVKFKFLSVSGVPINQINAEFPVDVNHLHGFRTVTKVSSEGVYFDLDGYESTMTTMAGGSSVEIARVNRIISGYATSSEYTVDLGKNFHNVVMARLISSEFPNTEQVVKDFPTSQANNKIYWQNLDDGDHVYSIEIEPGNYNPEELVTVMEKKFNSVQRINDSSANKYLATHTKFHFIQMAIDTRSDEVVFRSYRESLLSKPIVDIYPDIQEDPNLDPDFDDLGITDFEVTIEHSNHRLNTGDIILIKSSIPHMGIPSTVLNAEHEVSEIVSADRYKIRIARFNLSGSRFNTGGGVSVSIYTPSLFKLRFDYPDTMGRLLGFRNPGALESITDFQTMIKNTDLYEFDTLKTALGTESNLTHNSVNLSGDNYILMVINQFTDRSNKFTDIGPVKNIFAKILLTDIPGKTLFSSYVPMTLVFNEPIAHLSELEMHFYSPSGELYNFNGVDHSFTLEIMTKEETPEKTGFSARSGKQIIDVRKQATIE